MPAEFKDHFSGHARAYAQYRPRYPFALYEFLAATSPDTTCAWDCATGNGQVAIGLSSLFDRVIASDASEPQIAAAEPREISTIASRPPTRAACRRNRFP